MSRHIIGILILIQCSVQILGFKTLEIMSCTFIEVLSKGVVGI